jgi:hypothetical protein
MNRPQDPALADWPDKFPYALKIIELIRLNPCFWRVPRTRDMDVDAAFMLHWRTGA